MPSERLRQYLDDNHVKYVVVRHSIAYTAQETAAAAHIRGDAMAKTVIVRIDGRLAMVVVPATELADLQALRALTGAEVVELVPEDEFRAHFADCEPGAMPPFGNLYGMEVFVSDSLGEAEQIAFNAGTHRELIQLSYREFARLARPLVLRTLATR
jgi:Ala-tRNA(Pro) deacylase